VRNQRTFAGAMGSVSRPFSVGKPNMVG